LAGLIAGTLLKSRKTGLKSRQICGFGAKNGE
jgi:hypothetical protein